jgi:gamma-glutamylputrescine oxidase
MAFLTSDASDLMSSLVSGLNHPHTRLPQPTVWLPACLDEPASPVANSLRCDVAVVGGGFSGLSAALHLKTLAPQLDVVLVEAGRVGYGPSGLNSGQAAPRIGPAIEKQVATIGLPAARSAHMYSLQAMEFAAALVDRYAIDCDLRATSQWQVSLTDRDAMKLEKRSALYRELGFEVPLVDTRVLRAALPGSPRIRNAIAFPAYLMNPGRLCVGLKRAVIDAGVRLFEHSRARLSHGLTVGGFDIEATRIVLAVDGGIGALGHLGGAVLPIAAFAAVTRPLRLEERSAIGWADGQGLYDGRPVFNFLRPLPDGRLLIGGEYRYAHGGQVRPRDVSRSTSRLIEQLSLFFPSLSAISADAGWHGVLGCTLNEWPVIAPLDAAGRCWHLGAWNGHGVALALAAGHELAAALTNSSSGTHEHEHEPAPWRHLPALRIPSAATRFLLPAYLAWLRRASRLSL